MKITRRENSHSTQVDICPTEDTLIADVSVSKYKDDPFTDEPKINWCAIGNTSIERTEQFIEELQRAVVEAKKLDATEQ